MISNQKPINNFELTVDSLHIHSQECSIDEIDRFIRDFSTNIVINLVTHLHHAMHHIKLKFQLENYQLKHEANIVTRIGKTIMYVQHCMSKSMKTQIFINNFRLIFYQPIDDVLSILCGSFAFYWSSARWPPSYPPCSTTNKQQTAFLFKLVSPAKPSIVIRLMTNLLCQMNLILVFIWYKIIMRVPIMVWFSVLRANLSISLDQCLASMARMKAEKESRCLNDQNCLSF